MGSLIARLLALFAFKSRRNLIVAMGVAGLVLAAPVLLGPSLRELGLGRRARLVSDIAAIDRAKLKEPLLRESFDALLEDFAARPGGAPAAAAAAKPESAKPVAAKPAAKAEAAASSEATPDETGPSWLARLFGNGTVWTFIAGSGLWILLGLSGLFAPGVKIGGRLGVLALFLALGAACGVVAGRIDATLPLPAFAALVVLAEASVLAFLGTMTGELGARK
ncbi:MAG TPA: hypothetical protein PKW82_03320 [Spirochaetales bacterium]|nr:hypothetical protein [Spirochaetales bacterium]